MPSHPSIDHDGPAAGEAVSRLLREAKRLQRAAMSDSLAASLPVLRRLLASGSIPPASVPQAFRERQKLQRKHFLRTLAVEANFESWEECRATLALAKNSEPERAAALWRDPGQLNLWFGTVAEAAAFASTHGGNIVRVGRHAVVLPIHGELAGRSRA